MPRNNNIYDENTITDRAVSQKALESFFMSIDKLSEKVDNLTNQVNQLGVDIVKINATLSNDERVVFTAINAIKEKLDDQQEKSIKTSAKMEAEAEKLNNKIKEIRSEVLELNNKLKHWKQAFKLIFIITGVYVTIIANNKTFFDIITKLFN